MVRVSLEQKLDVELPDNFENYPIQVQENIIQYIQQLTPIEKKAFNIAKHHLGSSFHILRSNGYIEWIKHK
jgi:hypothetical protein